MARGFMGIVGALALIAGVVFSLQGFNVLQGSSMSGSNTWATAGPIIAVIGLALLVASMRLGHRHSGRHHT